MGTTEVKDTFFKHVCSDCEYEKNIGERCEVCFPMKARPLFLAKEMPGTSIVVDPEFDLPGCEDCRYLVVAAKVEPCRSCVDRCNFVGWNQDEEDVEGDGEVTLYVTPPPIQGRQGDQFVMNENPMINPRWSEDKAPKDDIVCRPNHYAKYKIEPITFVMENDLPFHVGNIVKYAVRAGSKLYEGKDAVESEIIDLEKVRRYAEMRINQLKEKGVLGNGAEPRRCL
jgi:hypothetical protein